MAGYESKLHDTKTPLWWAGWRWRTTVIIGAIIGTITLGAVISSSAGQAGFIFGLFLGAIGGFIWWWQGAKHINDIGPEIVEQFQSAAPKIGWKHLSLSGENTTGYWIRIGEGESPALDVRKRYKVQSLLVGDNSVAIHGGVYLDLVKRGTTVAENSEELYYDQISSVSYQNGALIIRTSDGGELSYPSSREPTDALNDLQNRVRAYKTS